MRRIYHFIVIGFLALVVQSPAPAKSKQVATLPIPNIDVLHYDVQATVEQMPPKHIPFVTTIDLKTREKTSTIDLHIESTVLTVESVTLGEEELNFKIKKGSGNEYGLSGSVLSIELPKPAAKGRAFQLVIAYDVKKSDWFDDKGIFVVRAKDNAGQLELITRGWPYYARYWLPSNDSPNDVATVSYKIRVPDGYLVASNGALKGDNEQEGSGLQSDGLRLFEWSQAEPTTTYNFVFAVGEYDIYKNQVCFNQDGKLDDHLVDCNRADRKIPVVLYYNKNNPQAKEIIQAVDLAGRATVYYSKLFGDYLFEKIGFVWSPYPFSMESTGMVVLMDIPASVHEMAHHWWDDSVHIAHWGDLWISEGFTTYATALYYEYKTGTNTACNVYPWTEDLNSGPETDANDIFTDTVYCKGAQALHDLRVRMVLEGGATPESTAAFFNLLRAVYKAYAQNWLSTQDLVAFVEKNMVAAFAAEKIPFTKEQAKTLTDEWKEAWFKGL